MTDHLHRIAIFRADEAGQPHGEALREYDSPMSSCLFKAVSDFNYIVRVDGEWMSWTQFDAWRARPLAADIQQAAALPPVGPTSKT